MTYLHDCIVNNKQPVNDGAAGPRVVKLLEAAERSLKGRGTVIEF